MPDPAAIATLDSSQGDDALEAALAAAGPVVVDNGVDAAWLESARDRGTVKLRPAVAVLSARTALRPRITPALLHWAIGHGMIAPEMLFNVQCVLQEAVVNAAIHGSCGLPGLGQFHGDHEDYTAEVERRLSQPEIGQMPVIVSFHRLAALTAMHVDDFGKGFSRRLPSRTTPLGPSGRGFTIMRVFSTALHLSRGGRRLSAGFRHA